MARYSTTHRGVTMQWDLARGRYHNAANPLTIWGYVDGVCRMQHATNARTKEQAERRVVSRIDEILAEAEGLR